MTMAGISAKDRLKIALRVRVPNAENAGRDPEYMFCIDDVFAFIDANQQRVDDYLEELARGEKGKRADRAIRKNVKARKS